MTQPSNTLAEEIPDLRIVTHSLLTLCNNVPPTWSGFLSNDHSTAPQLGLLLNNQSRLAQTFLVSIQYNVPHTIKYSVTKIGGDDF